MRNIPDTSKRVPCSDWTVRSYLKRGIVKGYKGKYGAWYLDYDAVDKIRRHMAAHGGPAGRSLMAPL